MRPDSFYLSSCTSQPITCHFSSIDSYLSQRTSQVSPQQLIEGSKCQNELREIIIEIDRNFNDPNSFQISLNKFFITFKNSIKFFKNFFSQDCEILHFLEIISRNLEIKYPVADQSILVDCKMNCHFIRELFNICLNQPSLVLVSKTTDDDAKKLDIKSDSLEDLLQYASEYDHEIVLDTPQKWDGEVVLNSTIKTNSVALDEFRSSAQKSDSAIKIVFDRNFFLKRDNFLEYLYTFYLFNKCVVGPAILYAPDLEYLPRKKSRLLQSYCEYEIQDLSINKFQKKYNYSISSDFFLSNFFRDSTDIAQSSITDFVPPFFLMSDIFEHHFLISFYFQTTRVGESERVAFKIYKDIFDLFCNLEGVNFKEKPPEEIREEFIKMIRSAKLDRKIKEEILEKHEILRSGSRIQADKLKKLVRDLKIKTLKYVTFYLRSTFYEPSKIDQFFIFKEDYARQLRAGEITDIDLSQILSCKELNKKINEFFFGVKRDEDGTTRTEFSGEDTREHNPDLLELFKNNAVEIGIFDPLGLKFYRTISSVKDYDFFAREHKFPSCLNFLEDDNDEFRNEVDIKKLKQFIIGQFKDGDEDGLCEIIFLKGLNNSFVENSSIFTFFFHKLFIFFRGKTFFEYYKDQLPKYCEEYKAVAIKLLTEFECIRENQERDFGELLQHPSLSILYQEIFFLGLEKFTPDYQVTLRFNVSLYEGNKGDDRLLEVLLNIQDNILIYLLKLRNYDLFEHILNDLISRDKLKLRAEESPLISFDQVYRLVLSNNHTAIEKIIKYAEQLNISEHLENYIFKLTSRNSFRCFNDTLFSLAVRFGFTKLTEKLLTISGNSDFFSSFIDSELLFDAIRAKDLPVIKKIFLHANFDYYSKSINFKKLILEYKYKKIFSDVFKKLLHFDSPQITPEQKPYFVELMDSKEEESKVGVKEFLTRILTSLEDGGEKIFENALKEERADVLEVYLRLNYLPKESSDFYPQLFAVLDKQIDQGNFRFLQTFLNYQSSSLSTETSIIESYLERDSSCQKLFSKALEVSSKECYDILRDLFLKHLDLSGHSKDFPKLLKEYIRIKFKEIFGDIMKLKEIFGDIMNLKEFLKHYKIEKLSNLLRFFKSTDISKLDFKDQSGKHCLDHILEIDNDKQFAKSLELMVKYGAKFSEISLSEQKLKKLKSFFKKLLDPSQGDSLIKNKDSFFKSLTLDKFDFTSLGLTKTEIQKIADLTPLLEGVRQEKDDKLTFLLRSISFTSLQVDFNLKISEAKNSLNKSLSESKSHLEFQKKTAQLKLTKLSSDLEKTDRIKKKDEEIRSRMQQLQEEIDGLRKEIKNYSQQILTIDNEIKERLLMFDDMQQRSINYHKYYSLKQPVISSTKLSESAHLDPTLISLEDIIRFLKNIEIYQEISLKKIAKAQVKTAKKDELVEEIFYYAQHPFDADQEKTNQQLQIIFDLFVKENISSLLHKSKSRQISLLFLSFLKERFEFDFDQPKLDEDLNQILSQILHSIKLQKQPQSSVLNTAEIDKTITHELSPDTFTEKTVEPATVWDKQISETDPNDPSAQTISFSYPVEDDKDQYSTNSSLTQLLDLVKLSQYSDKDLSQDDLNQIKSALLGYSVNFTSQESFATLEHGASHLEKENPLSDYTFGCASEISLDHRFDQKIIATYHQLQSQQKTTKKLPELRADNQIASYHLKALFHNLLEQLQTNLNPYSKTNFRFPEARHKLLDHIYPFIAYCLGSSQAEEQYLKDYLLITQGEAGSRSGLGHASQASEEQLKRMIWVTYQLLNSHKKVDDRSKDSLKKPSLNFQLFIEHLKKFKKTTFSQIIKIYSDKEFLGNLTKLFSDKEYLTSAQNQKLISTKDQLKLFYQNKLFFLTTILLPNKVHSEYLESSSEPHMSRAQEDPVQELLKTISQELLNKIFDCQDFSITQAQQKIASCKVVQDKLDNSVDSEEFFKILSDPDNDWLIKIINAIPSQEEISSVIEAKIDQLAMPKYQVAKTSKDSDLKTEIDQDQILSEIKQFLTLDLLGFSLKEFRSLAIGNFKEIEKSYLEKCQQKERTRISLTH